MFARNQPGKCDITGHIAKVTHQGAALGVKSDVCDSLFSVWMIRINLLLLR